MNNRIVAAVVAIVLLVLGIFAPAAAHAEHHRAHHPRIYRVASVTPGVSTVAEQELQRWHWRAAKWKSIAPVTCSAEPVQAKRRLQYRVATIQTALIGVTTTAVQVRTTFGVQWGRWVTVFGRTGCDV